MRRMNGKRSASSIVGHAPRYAEPHAETRRRVLTATIQRRQTPSKSVASVIELDIHKDSTAIGEAEAGRGIPRFIGTVRDALTLARSGDTETGLDVHRGPWREAFGRASSISCSSFCTFTSEMGPGSAVNPGSHRKWL
jgi:hypothetical protein